MKIMFVCHGNICRSPMGEYILKKMLSDEGIDGIEVFSRGVSSEEDGNDIYPPAKRVLREHDIPFSGHRARRISERDYDEADLILALDESNLRALMRRFPSSDKIRMLLDRGVEDPWYTGDFEGVYREISEGCRNIVKDLRNDIIN